MGFWGRLSSRILRELRADGPGRSAAASFFRVAVGPLLGALLGAALGALLGFWLVMAAGHGVAHSGAAAGLVLGFWAVSIVIGAVLGMGLFLVLSTLVRGGRFLLGRRPWPWSGSVHLGALLLGLAVMLGMRALGRYGATHAADSATLVQLAADTVGLLLALPAMVAGGMLAGWIHRRRFTIEV